MVAFLPQTTMPISLMAGKSPYSTELIEQCIKLCKSGVSVETVSKNTGVPTRTLYRWCKTHEVRGVPVDLDTFSNDPNFQKTLQARVMPHREGTAWIDNVEATVDRLGTLHSDLIYDLHRLLQSAIHSADVSPRAVNTLSLCLDRHMSGLLKVVMQGRERQIDQSQALNTLEAWGYMVLDGSQLREMFAEKEESPQNTLIEDKNEQ